MPCHTTPYAFLPFVIAFPALPNGLFRLAEKPVSCRDMVRPAPPYGQSGSAEKPFSSSVVTFFPVRQPKNAFPTPLFPLLTLTSSVPSVPLSPFPVVNIFYSLKRINIRSFTSSLSHPLTLSPPHFSLFTSLIFYPFTFKNLILPLPFYLFTLLIFIFSPSCSFSLIVKKYLFSVIFIPISLFCFHKSINFAEV